MKPHRPNRVPAHCRPLDRRYAERVPLHAPVQYVDGTGQYNRADGFLTDLSQKGCNISGSWAPAVGARVNLVLHFSDGKPVMHLSQATVSWVGGLAFTARFPPLTDAGRRRIQELIWKHATLLPGQQDRMAFRIV
ncbi:MAG TPA: PilZ domain-containing protein [Nitrospira sp.]|nr:PilZ domain-containing protein [Nitrospira sp.]